MSLKNLFDVQQFLDCGNPSFEYYFKITNLSMKLCAVHPHHEGGLFRKICKVVIGTILSIFIILVTGTIYEDMLGNRERMDAIRQIPILCLICLAFLKYVLLLKHSHHVSAILESIDVDHHAASTLRDDIETSTIVASYATISKAVQNFWAICPVLILLIFPIMSFGAMISSLHGADGFTRAMMFELYVPFIDDVKYESPFYEVVYLVTVFVGSFVCHIFIAYDGINMATLINICGRLEVVNRNLRNLFPIDDSLDVLATTDKFRRIVVYHQLCYRYRKKVQLLILLSVCLQTVTGTAHLGSLLLNSIVITSTGYHVLRGFENGYVAMDFILLFVSAFHIFLPCYFCDLLAEKSMLTSWAAYESGWELHGGTRRRNLRLRSSLAVLMMRAQRPILIGAAGMGAVNLRMFSSVIRTSWSYFTLVRRAQYN